MVCIVYDVTFEDALDRVSVLIAALLDGSRLIDSVSETCLLLSFVYAILE